MPLTIQAQTPKEKAELDWLDAGLRVDDARTALAAAQNDLTNRKRELAEAYKVYCRACGLPGLAP